MSQPSEEEKAQNELNKLNAKIQKLTGNIEASLNTKNLENIITVSEDEKNDSSNDFTNSRKVDSDNEAEVCCSMYSIQNPLFLGICIGMTCISILFFLYLINLVYEASNPKGIEVNQSDSMFFDYLVTDIFTIHNSTISSHSRDLSLDFNTPYGVIFNNMSIIPDGTIIATNCNFTELSFQQIKIRRSTILSITPQNDEIIFNLPTVHMNKSLRAMELDCSGFVIKNGKLFDSTGLELTWPSPGDSRYSFLSNSKLIDQPSIKSEHQIFNIHPQNTIIDSQNLLDDFVLTDISNENSNHVIPHKKSTIKESHNHQQFDFHCSNITANYNSFACIPNDNLSIIFTQCLDSKCKNTKTTKINVSNYLNTIKIEKMLIFNDKYISILVNQILYIFDKNSTKIDKITNVDDIDTVDDGTSRYLLYCQNHNLYQYPKKLILSFQKLKNDEKANKNPIKFSSEIFKSKLVIFSNCSGYNTAEKIDNEDITLFYNQGNINNFVIDRNGNIFAIDVINHQILTCDIKEKKCENLLNIEAEKNIQMIPLKYGGFVAISIDRYSKLSYHLLNKIKSKPSSKIITTKTSETADEIEFTRSKGRYPRIFAIRNGIPVITLCSNSKCFPGFAN